MHFIHCQSHEQMLTKTKHVGFLFGGGRIFHLIFWSKPLLGETTKKKHVWGVKRDMNVKMGQAYETKTCMKVKRDINVNMGLTYETKWSTFLEEATGTRPATALF